jgi:hypothetical protein
VSGARCAASPRRAGGAAATLGFGRADHGIGGWQQGRRLGASTTSSLPSTLAGAGQAPPPSRRRENCDLRLMALLLLLPPPRTVIPLTNSAPVPVGGGRWRAEDCGEYRSVGGDGRETTGPVAEGDEYLLRGLRVWISNFQSALSRGR